MDNVTNIEPADNEERLLKGILEGDTETNIEPAGNKERLLKGILENGGGGATSVTLAASGDNLSGDISLADLKTALSKGVVLLSFPTEGNADERVVAEYTDDSTNGLRIGVFSEDEYIVYSVVDDGDNGITLTVESESKTQGDLRVTITMTSLTGGTYDVPFNTLKNAALDGRRIIIDVPAVSFYDIPVAQATFVDGGTNPSNVRLLFLEIASQFNTSNPSIMSVDMRGLNMVDDQTCLMINPIRFSITQQ